LKIAEVASWIVGLPMGRGTVDCSADLLNTIGLVMDLCGVWIVASSVIVTHVRAKEATTSGWGGVSPAAQACIPSAGFGLERPLG